MVKLYNQYKDSGFEIVSINTSDTAEEVAEFFHKYNAKHIGALNGTNDDAAKMLGVTGTPANFVINREGRITAKIVGYREGDTRVHKAILRAGLGATE